MENDVPSDADVSEISALAELQLGWQKRVDTLEAHLKDAKEELRKIQEIALPAALMQAGVRSITLVTGENVSIKEDIYASIPKDERYHEALEWLREHGFADVIKNEIKVNFGKGEEALAGELNKILAEHGWLIKAAQNVTVHPSTLKALIKEQMAKGADIPMDLFGATPIMKAVIK